MIPIRDTVESSNYPVMNHLLIAVNVLVYFVQLAQGERLDLFIFIYGLVPARYSDPFLSAHFTTGQQLFSFLSFMFVHGGFWHILLNMWSLYIFGDNVGSSGAVTISFVLSPVRAHLGTLPPFFQLALPASDGGG